MYPTYLYIQSERNLWTVGFYDADGKWYAEKDYDSPQKAAERVAYLNGTVKVMQRCCAEPVTEILDAIRDSLANRNRDADDELIDFWADWLEQHAKQLREIKANDNATTP